MCAHARFLPVDGRFLPVDGRFLPVDGRFLPIDGRFLPVDGRFLPSPARFLRLAGHAFCHVQTNLGIKLNNVVAIVCETVVD